MAAGHSFSNRSARASSLLFAGLVIACTVFAFWPTWAGLLTIWNSDANTYAHGYLVAVVCLIAFAQAASRCSLDGAGADRLWLLVALAGGAGWLAAYLATIQLVQVFLIPGIIFCVLLSSYGTRSAPAWLFPFGYFYFAVPAWDYLNPYLLQITIAVNQTVLNAVRIPARIDNSFVHLAAGSFEIADGCSGLHFLVVMCALSAAYLYLNWSSLSRGILIFLISIAGALVVNWIRVSSVIVAGYVSDMRHYLVVEDHYVYGWLLFVLMALLLYWISNKIARPGEPTGTGSVYSTEFRHRSHWAQSVLALIVLCAGPLSAFAVDWRARLNEPAGLVAPQSIGEWRQDEGAQLDWKPIYPGATSEVLTQYRMLKADSSFGFYAAQYTVQAQGRELINTTNYLYRPGLWRLTATEDLRLRVDNGPVTVRLMTISSVAREDALIFSWYVVGDSVTTDAFAVKRKEIAMRLSGYPQSSIVAVRFLCGRSCERVRSEAIRFLESEFDFIVNWAQSPSTEVQT